MVDTERRLIMTGSILNDVKLQLGIDTEDTDFDNQILDAINTVIVILRQLGVGPDSFMVSNSEATWSDYLGEDFPAFIDVVSYMYAKVRMIFDPPLSSAVNAALNQHISELEFRLNMQYEYNRFKTLTGKTGEENHYV